MLLAAKSPEVITVATNDNLIRNCAYEVGATAVRAEDLPLWVDQAISYQGQALKNMPDRKKLPPFDNRIEIPNVFPPKE